MVEAQLVGIGSALAGVEAADQHSGYPVHSVYGQEV